MTRDNDPQIDTQHRLDRLQTRKMQKWNALQRLAGSSVLGVVAAWKLVTYEAAPPVDGEPPLPWLLILWLAIALLSFGLASWDQILNAIKR